MIDLKELKERESEIRENIKNRFMDVDFDEILTLQQKRYELLQKTEELRARRNANAQKMKGKMDQDERMKLVEEGKAIKEELQNAEGEYNKVDAEFSEKAKKIPNYASPEAPVGKEDKDSLAVKFVGEPRKFNFKAKDHVELGESLDILDFDTGAKVSGQKFYYIKNQQMSHVKRYLAASASTREERNRTSILSRVRAHALSEQRR